MPSRSSYYRNNSSVNGNANIQGITTEGASKSALFRNEAKYLYNDDYQKTKLNGWNFNSERYNDAMNNVKKAESILNNASATARGIRAHMNSPEGKEIEAKVNSILSNLSCHISNASSGVTLCGIWATQRYIDGVSAGKCSLIAVDDIDELKAIVKKYTAINGVDSLIKQLVDKYYYGQFTKEEKNNLQEQIEILSMINSKINPGSGKGTVNAEGIEMYRGKTFLETAQNCWKRLYENGRKIRYTEDVAKDVPLEWSAENWSFDNISYVDCSSMVDWMLYEYGYEEFGNRKQYTTYDFLNKAEEWKEKYGWKVQYASNGGEAAEKVESGDIVVFDSHMFIVKEKRDDGTIVTYDGGWQTHWTDKQTQQELNISNIGTLGYEGSIDGTTSGYFSKEMGAQTYEKNSVIITVEELTWDDVNFINSSYQ